MTPAEHARALALELIDTMETYLTVNAIPLTPEGSGTIVKQVFTELIRAMGEYDPHFTWRMFTEIRREQAGSNQ